MRFKNEMRTIRRSGFTLIELLVVMGIVILMVTLALVSVASMLRSSRMSRAVGLIVAAADEARTAAVTIRRSTKVDLTRIDAEGRMNRMTVVGPFFNENFESYQVYAPPAAIPVNGPAAQNWVTSGGTPYVESDGTRCLTVLDGVKYWISQLDTNARTRDNVRREFIASPEFSARVQRVVEQGCLQ